MRAIPLKFSILFFLILIFQAAVAQADSLMLKGHENLVGGIWKASGKWSDGTPFEQMIAYSWGLKKKILKTQTSSLEGSMDGTPQARNEGLRFYDPKTKDLSFIELDIKGGVTRGIIVYEQKNIFYIYPYGSGTEQLLLTDGWEFQDDDTYTYTVGIRENGLWKQKFLSTEMKRYKIR